ncbi:MAG TPA: c-type cytochrome [Vicinamibacterales bacterium]|nr:c-type cytochrome [Vicinamibacterales bacterium]
MSETFGKLVGLVGTVAMATAGLVLLARGPVVSAHASMAAAQSAQDTYLDKCAVCHGRDGAGKTAKGRKDKVKDVRETVKSMSEADMIKVVTDGKPPNMDSFKKDFSADQIKALVEYYRGLAK